MITYLKGDATSPVGEGKKIIPNVCNDIGAWGRGFVLSLSKKWPGPEAAYRRWYQDQAEMPSTFSGVHGHEGRPLQLGETMFVAVEFDEEFYPQTYVANMIGQTGIFRNQDGRAPIRYQALEACLRAVAEKAKKLNASVHMPRIGCGLAGGTWEEVEKIINKTLGDVQVFVYDFESDDARTIAWKK